METLTAIERFRPIAGERGVVLGELLDHALDASCGSRIGGGGAVISRRT
jgi:hypothetical protein